MLSPVLERGVALILKESSLALPVLSVAGTNIVTYRRMPGATTASPEPLTAAPFMEMSVQAKFKNRSVLFSR